MYLSVGLKSEDTEYCMHTVSTSKSVSIKYE